MSTVSKKNMLCSGAKINAYSMRNGTLTDREWGELSMTMGNPCRVYTVRRWYIRIKFTRKQEQRLEDFKLQYDIKTYYSRTILQTYGSKTDQRIDKQENIRYIKRT